MPNRKIDVDKERADVIKSVGQEIDRQLLRFLELLITLAGGIVGLVCAFLVQEKSFSISWSFAILLLSLFLYCFSIGSGFLATNSYLSALKDNLWFKHPSIETYEEEIQHKVLEDNSKNVCKAKEKQRYYLRVQILIFLAASIALVSHIFLKIKF